MSVSVHMTHDSAPRSWSDHTIAGLRAPQIVRGHICTGVSSQQYGPVANEVTSIPGWDKPMPSKQYAGYLPIPGTSKQLYYIFVLSLNDPSTDPVIVW